MAGRRVVCSAQQVKLTSSRWPSREASFVAEKFASCVRFVASAPAASKRSTIALSLFFAAKCRLVCPAGVAAFTFAPCCIKKATTAAFPFLAASIRGV